MRAETGAEHAPPEIRVRALGPLQVESADRVPVSWGGQRARTLFQYLLLHDRPVHREVLMEQFWPDHDRSSARGNLNVCIYGVRRALGGSATGFVTYRDGCYVLDRRRAWSIDRERFLRGVEGARREFDAGKLERGLATAGFAVDEYRGPLFEGDPYADWCEAERERLRELLIRTLERVAEVNLRLSDVDGAILALERAVREDPCRESANRTLMTCFSLRGQHDLVARQFQRCVAHLDRELAISPSTETVDLFHSLVGH